MELQWIDDFLALCQTRNFTRAAQARHTTQPAYSRRVQRLEEWLGAPLFYREQRPVTLTPAGEEFLARAPRLRQDILDARRAVLSASSVFKRSLRIFTTNTLAATLLPAWLGENRLDNYSVIVASISGCIEAVKRKSADMALVPHFGSEAALEGLSVRNIREDRLVLVATSAQAPATRLRGDRLLGPIMVYAPGTTYGAQIAAMLERRGLRIGEAPLCESASAEALLALVKAGLGTAWIPELLFAGGALMHCAAPDLPDIPYQILLLEAPREDLGG